jgi:hypothetical protein
MKLVKISAAAAVACLLATSVNAEEAKPKREIKGNMMEVYNTLPGKAENLTEAFTNGMFYGRLRTNAFKWDWKAADTWNPTTGKGNMDNYAFGLGGSMIYKTAPLAGVSATAGLYYADSPFSALRVDNADVGGVKAGKDVFSRYDVKNSDAWNMAVLAQAYIQYDFSKTTFKAGRQIFESFLTKSNDTKMIPNTFEGFTVETKELPDTTIRGAYFTAQKLRDHTEFHDVLTFKDSTGDSWGNNDDAAVHKGLSYAKLSAVGKEENKLIVADMSNKSIKNLKVDVTYGAVPGLVSSLTGELNYKIALPDDYSLTPGVRYMKQMDNGAGEIGGASLSGNITAANGDANGYSDGASLDSALYMARLVLAKGPMTAQIAYSAVADEGDIVAPWRGFPTGGYTRAMAQYNWRANTKTTAAEVKYNFGKANIIPGFTAMARYAMQDFDEAKQGLGGVQADSNILHMDFIQKIATGLEAKVRVGLVNAKDREDGTNQDSYNEYRFELNYLF